MNKKKIFALLIIAVCVQVFHFSEGSTTLQFFEYTYELKTSIAVGSFTVVGVIIGMLLR